MNLPALTLVVVGLLWVTGCTTNPVTGDQELAFVSESTELEVGQLMAVEGERPAPQRVDDGEERDAARVGRGGDARGESGCRRRGSVRGVSRRRRESPVDRGAELRR